jgi:ABC-type enterochelin transport system ATPase subunit
MNPGELYRVNTSIGITLYARMNQASDGTLDIGGYKVAQTGPRDLCVVLSVVPTQHEIENTRVRSVWLYLLFPQAVGWNWTNNEKYVLVSS